MNKFLWNWGIAQVYQTDTTPEKQLLFKNHQDQNQAFIHQKLSSINILTKIIIIINLTENFDKKVWKHHVPLQTFQYKLFILFVKTGTKYIKIKIGTFYLNSTLESNL